MSNLETAPRELACANPAHPPAQWDDTLPAPELPGARLRPRG